MAAMYCCAGGATVAPAFDPAKLSTSFEVIIPSMPLPVAMREMSTPFSAASSLAAGLAKGRSTAMEGRTEVPRPGGTALIGLGGGGCD